MALRVFPHGGVPFVNCSVISLHHQCAPFHRALSLSHCASCLSGSCSVLVALTHSDLGHRVQDAMLQDLDGMLHNPCIALKVLSEYGGAHPPSAAISTISKFKFKLCLQKTKWYHKCYTHISPQADCSKACLTCVRKVDITTMYSHKCSSTCWKVGTRRVVETTSG